MRASSTPAWSTDGAAHDGRLGCGACGRHSSRPVTLAVAVRERDESPRRDGRVSRMLDEAGFAHASTMRPVLIAVVLCALFCAISWLVTGLGAVAVVAALAGAAAPFAWLRGRARRLRRSRRALWSDVCDPLDLLRPCGCVASGCRGGSRDEWSASAASCVRALPLRHGGVRTLRLQRAAPQGSPRRSGGRPHHRDSPDGAAGRRNRADRRAPRALGIRACRRHPSRRGGGETVLVRGAAIVGVVAPWIVLGLLALRPRVPAPTRALPASR